VNTALELYTNLKVLVLPRDIGIIESLSLTNALAYLQKVEVAAVVVL
jgi:hypothetical protein